MKTRLALLLTATLILEFVINGATFINMGTFRYFSDMLVQSPLVLGMKLVVLFLSIVVVLFIDEHENTITPALIVLVGTVIFFMLVLVSSNHLIVLYIALEGMSLLLFVLTSRPKSAASAEAGFKYFLQSSFASVRLLLGIALRYASTQHFTIDFIRLEIDAQPVSELLEVGLSLIIVAMLFKIAAFPGHFWSPDVYRGPQFSIANFFAVAVKATSVFMLINLHVGLLVYVYPTVNPLIFVSSVFSMILGLTGGLQIINKDGDIRTFIAYTGISQVGFILMGLAFVNYESAVASLVYLLTYLISSVLFIGMLSRFRYYNSKTKQTRGFETFGDFKLAYASTNQSVSRRYDLFVVALSIWSMAGLPPLAGFVGKISI